MHCCAQCPRPCSRPPLTHTFARDSWPLTGKSGSVSCGVTAPFSWVATWVQSQKWQNDLCLILRQTIQYHSNPNLRPNQKCWRSWSWIVLWRPTRPSRTNTQKRCPFHHRGLECKGRKSRNTWSYRQIWPCNVEWSRSNANRVLLRKCTGHSKHPLPTAQKTLHMDISGWSIQKSDWLYSLQPKMEKLYTVSKNKTGSWLWLRSWTPYCQIQT